MLPYSHTGFCCPLPINSGGRGLVKKERIFFSKATHFWKNNRLLLQSPFSFKHPKVHNPSTSCQFSSRMRLESLLPLKTIPFFVICRRLQHDYAGGLVGSQSQSSFRRLCVPAGAGPTGCQHCCGFLYREGRGAYSLVKPSLGPPTWECF